MYMIRIDLKITKPCKYILKKNLVEQIIQKFKDRFNKKGTIHE